MEGLWVLLGKIFASGANTLQKKEGNNFEGQMLADLPAISSNEQPIDNIKYL